jgi:hypothetical protein
MLSIATQSGQQGAESLFLNIDSLEQIARIDAVAAPSVPGLGAVECGVGESQEPASTFLRPSVGGRFVQGSDAGRSDRHRRQTFGGSHPGPAPPSAAAIICRTASSRAFRRSSRSTLST